MISRAVTSTVFKMMSYTTHLAASSNMRYRVHHASIQQRHDSGPPLGISALAVCTIGSHEHWIATISARRIALRRASR